MRRNVEIKARVENLGEIRRAVEAIADAGSQELRQVDTFFRCENGRLKLRVFGDSSGELIYYERLDIPGPRESKFLVYPTADAASLMQILRASYGVLGVVEKKRVLYMVGQTRVHLDEVNGLGSFVEIEVMLREDQTVEDGAALAEDLMKRLGIQEQDLVEGAYLDLLRSHSP